MIFKSQIANSSEYVGNSPQLVRIRVLYGFQLALADLSPLHAHWHRSKPANVRHVLQLTLNFLFSFPLINIRYVIYL